MYKVVQNEYDQLYEKFHVKCDERSRIPLVSHFLSSLSTSRKALQLAFMWSILGKTQSQGLGSVFNIVVPEKHNH